MINTKRFNLRQLNSVDVNEGYLDFMKDTQSQRFIVAAKTQQSLASIREYLEERRNRNDVLFLGIFLARDGRHIGNIKFEPLDSASGKATVGILIGDSLWQGHGVATEVLVGCTDWLHRHRSIYQVTAGIHRENIQSIRAFEKAGFKIFESGVTHPDKLMMIWSYTDISRKLVIGTAQFGMQYGIANRNGQLQKSNIVQILSEATKMGINTLDTAIEYGNSEQILGEIGVAGWHVITKLPTISKATSSINNWVKESVDSCLKRLKINCLYGLLLHRPVDLLGKHGETLYDEIMSLKRQGYIKKVGVSVYNPEEIDILVARFEFDLVQVPLNVFDRRFLTSGWLRRLKLSGVEVHIRSIFFQGLLLLPKSERGEKFKRWDFLFNRWDEWVLDNRLTRLQACLGFVMPNMDVDKVVVGMDSCKHLRQILSSNVYEIPAPPEHLLSEDLQLLNPSNWSTLQ